MRLRKNKPLVEQVCRAVSAHLTGSTYEWTLLPAAVRRDPKTTMRLLKSIMNDLVRSYRDQYIDVSYDILGTYDPDIRRDETRTMAVYCAGTPFRLWVSAVRIERPPKEEKPRCRKVNREDLKESTHYGSMGELEGGVRPVDADMFAYYGDGPEETSYLSEMLGVPLTDNIPWRDEDEDDYPSGMGELCRPYH